MPNPSTTQVIELREQIARAHDAGGVNRDRIWALACFQDDVAIPVAETSLGCKPHLGVLDHWRRERCPSLRITRHLHVRLTLANKRELKRSEEHTSELQSLRHLVC